MYNIKVLNYSNEVQINYFNYVVGTKEKKERESNANNKRSTKADKQSSVSSNKSCETCNEIDNKVRSTRRSKQSIYNIARANVWEYFATFTFKEDRYNYDICKKHIQTYLNNLKKRKCSELEYLAVPEQHKDGAYHFHALLKGVNKDVLCDSWEKGRLMLKSWKYGISQCEEVKDTNRVAMYISKYITKDLVNTVKGRQRYLCSNGCKRADELEFYVDDMSILEFIENNFPNHDISYIKKCEKAGYKVDYIQLKKQQKK